MSAPITLLVVSDRNSISKWVQEMNIEGPHARLLQQVCLWYLLCVSVYGCSHCEF